MCRDVRPRAPHTVSPAAFDARVDEDRASPHPRFADVPRARSVRRRLAGLNWYELLALIFDTERSTEHYLAIRRRRVGREVDEDECIVALRTVASRLAVATVRPHEFAAARRELVREDGRAWLHGVGQEHWFPTAAQIEGVFRTDDEPGWDRALLAAGLQARGARGGSRAGVPVVRAMEWFLIDMGCLPWSREPLKEYAAAASFSLAASRGHWGDYIDALRADRDLLGLWTPPAVLPRGQRPTVGPPRAAEVSVPRRTKARWEDMDALVAGVAKVYDLAAELDCKLTQPLHRQLAKAHPGVIPSPSVVDRNAKKNGRTADWVRDQAKRLRRERDVSHRSTGP